MKEIERKFLVTDDSWRSLAGGTLYRQGYLTTDRKRTVRVRIVEDKGFLTIKGLTTGAVRAEYEYEIPVEDARSILKDLCEGLIIEKKDAESNTKDWFGRSTSFSGRTRA